MTWNVHHGVGTDGRLDLGRIAAVLARCDADVVGLQEVDRGFDARSDWRDQAGELAERLGLHLLRGPAIRRPGRGPGEPEGEYGVALLTRAPADLVELVPMALPHHEPRVVLHARVPAAAGALSVLVTHLDAGSRAARRWQAQRVAALGVALPAVLLADLNARPGVAELAPLAGAGWRDAWSEAPERASASWPFPGATVSVFPSRWASWSLLRCTQLARLPVRRVDAVLVRGRVAVRRAEVPRVEGSDHRPVVVDLEPAVRGDGGRRPGAGPARPE